jgi:hypothetical protein
MGYLLTGLGLLFIVLMLAAFSFFDKVLKIQYAEFKSEWEKAGAPHGFFWVPKESQSKIKIKPNSASTRARTKHFFSWLFRTPEWIGQNPAAKANIFKVRTLFVISLTVLASFVILYVTR